MCEVVKVSTVKTRKDHKCFGCNRNFPASCELERQVINSWRKPIGLPMG